MITYTWKLGIISMLKAVFFQLCYEKNLPSSDSHTYLNLVWGHTLSGCCVEFNIYIVLLWEVIQFVFPYRSIRTFWSVKIQFSLTWMGVSEGSPVATVSTSTAPSLSLYTIYNIPMIKISQPLSEMNYETKILFKWITWQALESGSISKPSS